jgi:hypothetical protein
VGVGFTAAIYPVAVILWKRDTSGYADAMMGSIYLVLGISLLLALRNPFEHRSLILFAGWSSLAHAAVMTIMALRDPSAREFLMGVAIFAVAGIPLVLLAPRRKDTIRQSAAGA